MKNLKHGEKIVDGILIKYLCQPCPGCKAKLEAGEEMARTLKNIGKYSEACQEARIAWEKAKGET